MKKIKQLINSLQDLKYITTDFLFEPCGLWVGFFWDKKKHWLYFLPFPTLGLIIKFESVSQQERRVIDEHVRNLSREELAELVSKHILASDPSQAGIDIKITVYDPKPALLKTEYGKENS